MSKRQIVIFSVLVWVGWAAAQTNEPESSGTGSKFFQSLNPDMSVILDGTFGYSQRAPSSLAGDDPSVGGSESSHGLGFTLQEAEIAFSAAVDPYLKGELYLTIPNLQGIEVEEGFFTTGSLPWNFQIKGGKFRSSFGRQNGQHLHIQDFTRRPLVNQTFLGVDGLSAPGAEVNWLAPFPFYSLLAVEFFSVAGPDDPGVVQSFGGGDRSDLTTVATWKNFFPLAEDVDLNVGLSYGHGRSAEAQDPAVATPPAGNELRNSLIGADLYLKWKPVNYRRGYYSLAWQTEFILRHWHDSGLVTQQNEGGMYTQLVYQFLRRWYAGARFDYLGLPAGDFIRPVQRYSGSVTFAPSEFSRFRLYAEEEVIHAADFPAFDPTNSFGAYLQFEISIGAHGAHPY